MGADRGRGGLSGRAPDARRAAPRARRATLATALALALACAACSPLYLIRAGWAEAKILTARRPIPEVATDPATDDDTRGKLALTLEARRFAIDSLELRAGDSYTTFTRLERDTLALVLSAAPADRLEPKTWWFPIVGDIPYRAYFDYDDARSEQARLRNDGFDTYLRPTAAFSTLGWFSDPLLSTVLTRDHVGVVETVLHELAHNHLYVPGHTRFNESFATFVGGVGAIRFFCGRPGGGPDTVWCNRARDRWADDRRFSTFLDALVADLRQLYGRTDLSRERLLAERSDIFEGALERFRTEVAPELRSRSFRAFTETPLDNATLLARMRYYHRLDDFQAHLDSHGGHLRAAIRSLARDAEDVDDPFRLLPVGEIGEDRTEVLRGSAVAPRARSPIR